MVRVRFAPSPTGFLHIGGARTYIFNWLYARQKGGVVVLRIDDTDLERNTEASRQSIFDGLGWLELGWGELYSQSERSTLHRQAAQELLDQGVRLPGLHAGGRAGTGARGPSAYSTLRPWAGSAC